jgi:hypothetical protein
MAATIDALFPLSLLEAVRDIDTPAENFDTEFVPELRNKRFGLSETVYTQIRRYSEAVRRNQRSSYDEAVALARLIGRRPDAEAVFREAGRVLAQAAYATVSPMLRQLLVVLPAFMARPLAVRRMGRLGRRYLSGTVTRSGDGAQLEVPASVTTDTSAPAGCAYYEASLGESLRFLTGASVTVEHVRCAARGEGNCVWRASWGR